MELPSDYPNVRKSAICSTPWEAAIIGGTAEVVNSILQGSVDYSRPIVYNKIKNKWTVLPALPHVKKTLTGGAVSIETIHIWSRQYHNDWI